MLKVGKRIAPWAIIISIPFVVFYWMVPFLSDRTLGLDYTLFSISHQMELMFSIKNGSFPLYIPGYVGGRTSMALTLGQHYHPISYLAMLLPGYWTGKALELNTLLRLLSLGGTHMALYSLIRKMRIGKVFSLIISTVTVYQLRTLILFQYGASLESWTGQLLLCTAIGWYYLQPTRWLGPLTVIGATYWIICSGHPQVGYYGLLAAGIFALIFPHFISYIMIERKIEIKDVFQFWVKIGFFVVVGIILSSAYILPFYFDFLKSNIRNQLGYSWANEHCDTFMGTLNNFFFPFYSYLMGIFGGSYLFVVSVLSPLVVAFRVKVPRVIWLIWGIIFIIFLHMQGGRTPVHFIFYKYMPLASSFRLAGRMSVMFPILFMILLIWVLNLDRSDIKIRNKNFKVHPSVVPVFISLVLLGIFSLLPDSIIHQSHWFCPANLTEIPAWIKPIILLSGGGALLILLFHGFSQRKEKYLLAVLGVLIVFHLMFLFRYGTGIELKHDTRTLSEMMALKEKQLDFEPPTIEGEVGDEYNTKQINRQINESFLEPFLGKIYYNYILVSSTDHAYDLMSEGRVPNQAIIENYKPKIGRNRQTVKEIPMDHVELSYSSFNRLVFNIETTKTGFFVLAYPYSKNWRANINNEDTMIYPANGMYQSVRIPIGKSKVEFRYFSPAAFWGMIISCTMFILVFGFVSIRAFPKPINIFPILFFVIIGGAVFSIWYGSLYSGKNLNTKYVWSSKQNPSSDNLAYGKPTQMISDYINRTTYRYLFDSSRAIDGDFKPQSGFRTKAQMNPWWMVDLKRSQPVGVIKVFKSNDEPGYNNMPFEVLFSNNKIEWKAIKIDNDSSPLVLNLVKPLSARYISIRASGVCVLSLDEVEIYPPAKHSVMFDNNK